MMVKGADISVQENSQNKISENFANYIDFYLESGLRVMFMGFKLISEDEYQKFRSKLSMVESDKNATSEDIYKIKQEFEKDLFLFGASAIEDKLQENLKETIDMLKLAEIKLWVITGDKSDTAKNIAYSSGLFRKDQPPIEFDMELMS